MSFGMSSVMQWGIEEEEEEEEEEEQVPPTFRCWDRPDVCSARNLARSACRPVGPSKRASPSTSSTSSSTSLSPADSNCSGMMAGWLDGA